MQSFKLINEEVQIQNPTDQSYVYNGYSPLSVKFIENFLIAQGFGKLGDMLKQLPGAHDSTGNDSEFFVPKVPGTGPSMADQGRKKRILIYFIGGITYGEIAAIRFLNNIFKDKKFIIATTQIINGDACVGMLRGDITNRLSLSSILAK